MSELFRTPLPLAFVHAPLWATGRVYVGLEKAKSQQLGSNNLSKVQGNESERHARRRRCDVLYPDLEVERMKAIY